MAILLVAAGLTILYNNIYTSRSDWKTSMILKEQVDGVDYLYVQEEGELLRLRCADTVDFDQLTIGETVYLVDCRWNRWTGTGTVTSCVDSGDRVLRLSGLIGSSMGFDFGEEDTLFGYSEAIYTYEYVAQDPYHIKEVLYTISVFAGTSQETLEKVLTVEQCYGFCQTDYDRDGVTELAVRTRWAEKPYTIYNMV